MNEKTKTLKRYFFIIFLFLSLFLITKSRLFTASLVFASHCPSTNYDCQITEIQKEIDALRPAQEYNKKELDDLRKQIKSFEKRIVELENQLDDLSKDIATRKEDLAYTREIFEEKTANHYKFLRVFNPLMPFFSSISATNVLREMNLRKKVVEDDKGSIEAFVIELIQLKSDTDKLVKNKENLSQARRQVSSRANFLAGEVEKTESYLSELSSKQQELAAAKAGGFQTSIGDTPPTLDPCSGPPGSSNFCDPGFRPAFAGFSFGAPHRTGMSQYGAYGRSKQGQSAETILSAYYQGASLNKGYPTGTTIHVVGCSIGRYNYANCINRGYSWYDDTIDIETYTKRIYEVPASWGNNGGMEALKAQAVASRSYALSVTNNGAKTICPSESCQVYKPVNKGGNWEAAVNSTSGWVMTKGGIPATTYYSSTTGGYTISQWGWSGINDSSGNWPDTAYEKVSGSPWFYKGWYKSRGGASCGRGNPWLTSTEMADILNAWKVVYQGGGDVSRVTPIDTNCWGGNPYSNSELASIGGFDSVSSLSVVYSSSGSTQSVNFSTNKGSVTISGSEIKKAFNLRAPGYVGIKSSLFNIEKI